jgi:hypothetical protein
LRDWAATEKQEFRDGQSSRLNQQESEIIGKKS